MMAETQQHTIAGSRGSIVATIGDTFHDVTYGGDWEIVRFDFGDRSYSPSVLGGTFTIRCKPLSDVPPYWRKYIEDDGTVEWCADSVASAMLRSHPEPTNIKPSKKGVTEETE